MPPRRKGRSPWRPKIQCFHLLAACKQNRCLTPGHGCPLDLPSELFRAGTLQIVHRVGLGLGQQAERSVERACVQVREGGRQRPVSAPPGSAVKASDR